MIILLYFLIGATLAGAQAAIQRDFDSDQTFITGLGLFLAWPLVLLLFAGYYGAKQYLPKRGRPCRRCGGTGVEPLE